MFSVAIAHSRYYYCVVLKCIEIYVQVAACMLVLQ